MTIYPSSRNPGFTPRRPSLSLLATGMMLATLFATAVSPARGQGAPGSLDTGFAPNLGESAFVGSIGVRPDGRIVISGQFAGVARLEDDSSSIALASLTSQGELDRSFHPSTDRRTIAEQILILPDGKLFLSGGPFFAVGDFAVYLLRLNPDAGVDASFQVDTGANSSVSVTFPQSDGRLFIYGSFYRSDNFIEPRTGLERIFADGSVDRSFQPQLGPVEVDPVVAQPDGKVIINLKGTLNRLNTDGSVDGTYRTSVFSAGRQTFNLVETMVRQPDGKVLVGGIFDNVNGFTTAGVARLNVDGSVDTSFRVPADTDNRVSVLALQADGKVIVGGFFTRLGGVTRGHLARLNTDGSVDGSFAAGAGADDLVEAVTLQPDNKVLIGGAFSSYDGVPRTGLARLNNTVTPPVNAGTFSVVGTPTRGGFVVSRTGSTDAAATVLYHNGGSAIRDGDYVAFPGTLTFAAGQVEAVIPVRLLAGANRNKKVKVFLDPGPTGAYSIGKAQSKVFLSDL